jgi:SMI1 / KNR4 family (SUKH-1)
MIDSLENWLATAYTGVEPTATEAELCEVESHMGRRLPDEIRHVLNTKNRPEGFIGKSYVAFFNTHDLIQCWRDAQESAPGFVPFASNGGGEWYGFDARQDAQPFLLMPAIGMEWGAAMFLGANWGSFWGTLQHGNLFDQQYRPPQDQPPVY